MELATKQDLIELLVESRAILNDNKALIFKDMYPKWSAGIIITQKMIDDGKNRYSYGDKLYKCGTPHTTQADWTPDITPAMWTVIDVEHTGTVDDPIPFVVNMEAFNGKYYIYADTLYLCIRDSGIALQHTPDQLIGNYFEVA